MSALDAVPSTDDNLGHWHPASRPDTETRSHSDREEPHIEQDALVVERDLAEPAQGLEDFGLEDAPVAAQARIVSEEEGDEAAQQLRNGDGFEQGQQTVDNHQTTSRVVSWAAQPTSTVAFEAPDIPSDEDEERLDPAWGIRRTDSAQILQTINRSTSFPSFESPTGLPDGIQERPLPHSQVDDILQQMDSNVRHDTRFEDTDQLEQATNDARDDWARAANEFTEDAQTQAIEPQSATDTEARFEEGMPLISTKSEAVHTEARMTTDRDKPNKTDPFATAEDEESFFNHVGTLSQPPPLDRKTTADVLDHLGSHPGDPSDSPTHQLSRAPTVEDPAANGEFERALGIAKDEGEIQNGTATVEDPWAAALDDDEFLIDDDDDLLPDSSPGSPSSFNDLLKGNTGEPDEFLAHLHEETSAQMTPPSTGRGQRPEMNKASSSNPYAPHQPSTSDLTQLSPTTYGNVGFNRPVLAPMTSFQQQLQQRPTPPQKTESFVDQKGGYKSPYDLPMEIAKPRKRPQIQPPVQTNRSMPPPPPRTSSISSSQGLQSPFSPTFPAGQVMAAPSQSSRPTPRSATVASPPKASSATKSSFFEELPITSRPRPATVQGRYTPQQNASIPPPQFLPQSPPSIKAQPSPPQPTVDPYAQYQLRAPEKLDPYANVPLQVPSALAPPVANVRYSPNPTAAVGAIRPSPSPRYSPAPPPQAAHGRYATQPAGASAAPPARQYTPVLASNTQQPSAALPFQPRTSSPLAYMGRSVSNQTQHVPQSQQVTSAYDSNTLPSRYPPTHAQKAATSPPAEMPPPRRSQTQSPGKRDVPSSLQALVNGDFQRPASVPGPISPTRGPPVELPPPVRPSVRQRGMTSNFNFIEPTDGQELDVLQRWKGAPIFNFGFGGSVLSSFPKHIPRFSMNSTAPLIKSGAGEVHVRNMADVVSVPDHITSFPGPLRSKSRKKDVLAWLKSRITALEQEHSYLGTQTQATDLHKRRDEKVLLWKIVQAVVEHDGVLEGSPAFQKSVGTILSPDVHSLDDALATQYGVVNDTSGIYRPTGSTSHTETVDADAVESLRKHLLRGEREKAVWTAVDKRLWSHALLVASTLEPTVWKQVVQEFVRQEVKLVGNNTESLAALYEVFAGNYDESIDELVPPSARAGLQMVSKLNSLGPTKNALDGLDCWRETLSLVLSNRTNNDIQALAALGKLLMSYGRIEAAHICYIFARTPTQPLFGGVDDPYAGVVLLGADHQGQPTEFFRDEDAILLTEVYEFAVTVLASNLAASVPHFQVYKLQRASWLADIGRKLEAQAYCEALTPTFKASTKISPYYNGIFFAELEDLASRLKQVPIKSSSSWKTTPSLEKVGNSLFNKLSNFVAGDDSDADSKGSGKDVNHEFGPFANVAGTPSLSRTGSSSDLYGGYPSSVPMPTTAAGSRYAPNGLNTARSSSELGRGRPSVDSQRSPPSTGYSSGARPNPYEQLSFGPPSHMSSQANVHQPVSQLPPINQYQATPPQTSYMPQIAQESPQRSYVPQQQDSYIPTPPPESIGSTYMPTPPLEPASQPPFSQQPSFGGYEPLEQQDKPEVPQIEASNGYEAPAPIYGGYEPPSGYVPYEPEPESPEQKPVTTKKKSYMDDEDDFPRAQNSYNAQPADSPATTPDSDAAARKRANDAAADAAFRAAAEADAAKANSQTLKPKGSGWFNVGVPSVPFFGGAKKVSNSLDAKPAPKGSEPKVHRVHLGESKMSIYYDDKLKKWVNPNDPESSKPKATPPPPPGRGATPLNGPPRGSTPSATMPNLSSSSGPGTGMGSGPPSRVGTPGDNLSGAGTPPPLAGPLASLNPTSGPPSRPATGQSGGAGGDLDDLLGPGTGGRRTVKGKKGGKGRYIDVMAK